MPEPILPPLDLDSWRPTRDTLHGYVRVLGKVRAALTPCRRHFAHGTLHVAAAGLTTTPMPAGGGTVEALLDLGGHWLRLTSSGGGSRKLALDGRPASALCRELVAALAELGARPGIDCSVFDQESAGESDGGDGAWHRPAVERFHRALSAIEPALQEFKGRRRRETSPVQLFPHHFDLALSWYSGRLVPGADPADEAAADEAMTFGFSTGDDAVPEPYLYGTAHPEPDGFTGSPLPAGACWEANETFRGALLPYAALRTSTAPHRCLLDFLEAVHRAGAERMVEG